MCDKARDEESNPSIGQALGGTYAVRGSGDYYVNSIKRQLETRKHTLIMELNMVQTALDLCTPEVEKAIQLQTILNKLPKR